MTKHYTILRKRYTHTVAGVKYLLQNLEVTEKLLIFAA